MKAASEMLVSYHSTIWHHSLEDLNLNLPSRSLYVIVALCLGTEAT